MLNKATSLVTDLFLEGKIEKSHEKTTIYPIADGIWLQYNSSVLQASVRIAEIIDVTLFIGKNVALTIACGLAVRYLTTNYTNMNTKWLG
jgi:hypothetical protein